MSDAPATARSRRTAARARGRGPGRRYNLWLGGLLIGTIVAGALLGFVWSPHPPNTMDFTAQLQPPSAEHWLGTDHFGRDLFSRLLVGARGTLYVGFIAVGIALVAGTVLGAVATHLVYGVRFLQGLCGARLPSDVRPFDHQGASARERCRT